MSPIEILLTYFILGIVAGLVFFYIFFSKKKLKAKVIEKGIGEEYNPVINITKDEADASRSAVDQSNAVDNYIQIK